MLVKDRLGVEPFFKLTSSHAKAVLSPELASLARHPYVLIPDTKELGGKKAIEGKTLSSDIEQVCL